MIAIKEDGNGFSFEVRSGQGQLLLRSVGFASREDLEACLREACLRLGNPACFERMTNHDGKFRFCLKGARGKVLGKSALYSSEAGMENGIKNTRIALSRADLP